MEDNDIIKESRRWVLENSGYKLQEPAAHYYSSPRISSELMDCSLPLTFDHFNFCSLGCLYCFAYTFKSQNPSVKNNLVLSPVNVKKMISEMEGKKDNNLLFRHFYKHKFVLHWGGLADPFCEFEKTNGVGFTLLQVLGGMNYPTLFSFKGKTILEDKYLKLFSNFSKQKNFAFQISMVTSSDRMAKDVEIGVPLPSKRFEIMKILSDMGYWTILRLRPFIIGVTDETLDELLSTALSCGIKGISTEFFAMDLRANEQVRYRYEWLGKLVGTELDKYFKALSPRERGGYLRLNRLIKEKYVKRMYKFCVDNNLVFACSDPDYKELNTSGSCCGLPREYPDNPLLENWSRNQLTYHLKEARKMYHKEGKIKQLIFSEVYGDPSYLSEKRFANDHVGTSDRGQGEVFNLTLKLLIREYWNNLKSYANPMNYFHGKVMPVDRDDDGDLIYNYVPMDYEERWKKEGINLKV